MLRSYILHNNSKPIKQIKNSQRDNDKCVMIMDQVRDKGSVRILNVNRLIVNIKDICQSDK